VENDTALCVCPYHTPTVFLRCLKDSRVSVGMPRGDGYTPLRCAARGGFLDLIKLWIASGREMDLGKPE